MAIIHIATTQLIITINTKSPIMPVTIISTNTITTIIMDIIRRLVIDLTITIIDTNIIIAQDER